jgi:hypothetical protein
MHPALYAAVIEARQSDLRRARRHEVPAARKPRSRFSLRVAFRPRRVATP